MQPQGLLPWLYVGRLCVSGVLFGAAALVWQNMAPGTSLAITLVLLATAVFTIAGFWYTHLAHRQPGYLFLAAQVAFDTLLVTSIVYLTGGGRSIFAPLYILVICAAAILLPIVGGILFGVLAISLYTAVVAFTSGGLETAVMLQIALFAVVALVTGYLGDRLRQTGATLGKVQTELRQLRLDTDDILDTINSGVLTVDEHGRLIYMNRAAEDLLGVPASRWLGEPAVANLDQRAPGLGSVIARSAEGGAAVRRHETQPSDTFPFVLGVSTTLIERSNGARSRSVTAIFQDITERKRVEALRRRAERLESVAELSASLAHEIRNPLASIRSATEQLASDGLEAGDQSVLKSLVVRESDRLSRLLSEFLDFARIEVSRADQVDIISLVEQVVSVLRAHPDAEGKEICFAEGGPDRTGAITRGDPDLIHRALLNLGLNAIQWAGSGGRVCIELESVRSDLLSSALAVSKALRIQVSDSGPGVPPDRAEHIFDPFFTLRPGGTGLGLALVQRAAEAHSGVVVLEENPRPGWGTTFSFYLPVDESGE